MTDYELTPNFSRAEFLCKHCGKSGIQMAFVEHLQALRDAIGVPLKITSGYRCPQHWDEVKKPKGPGQHTKGIAADLYAIGKPLSAIYRLVLKDFPEFRGIGVAPHQGFIHLDSRPIPAGQRAVVWAYDAKGKQVKWDGRWENLPK